MHVNKIAVLFKNLSEAPAVPIKPSAHKATVLRRGLYRLPIHPSLSSKTRGRAGHVANNEGARSEVRDVDTSLRQCGVFVLKRLRSHLIMLMDLRIRNAAGVSRLPIQSIAFSFKGGNMLASLAQFAPRV